MAKVKSAASVLSLSSTESTSGGLRNATSTPFLNRNASTLQPGGYCGNQKQPIVMIFIIGGITQCEIRLALVICNVESTISLDHRS
jgi:hypothetical protein